MFNTQFIECIHPSAAGLADARQELDVLGDLAALEHRELELEVCPCLSPSEGRSFGVSCSTVGHHGCVGLGGGNLLHVSCPFC